MTCIETSNSRNRDGYGKTGVRRFGKVIWRCHVLAWVDANGRLPGPGMVIRHSCDNPPCINPEHLYEGTQAENVRDMLDKGRGNNQRKTHCPVGHEYDNENTRIYRGFRHCRACDRIRNAVRRERVMTYR